ncbi:MAG: 4-(cytidine 5'-diphospho)-2-C-methyl-D-erythritol kinase, partial [Porticoccaceae bacterium]|nr:4-(cytidine 5'-diphospho)-2-C-methyl-D-erythritol kinase [Porticoccaceae bacterium]
MLQILAPAKLNLFLRITGRRPDGYHELQTLFQLLDYGDDLSFELRTDKALTLAIHSDVMGTDSIIPEQSGSQDDLQGDQNSHLKNDPYNNLVTRAALSLQQHASCSLGADIQLTKRLPIGGGLGGGSSDAATTLIALNKLWNLNYSLDHLAEIGLKLGADVPVFIHGHTAWAEGIGEHLHPVDMPPLWYLVIMPSCSVSTAEIFSDHQLTRNASPITIRAFRDHGAGNDCQDVAEKRHPEVKTVRLWLNQYAPAQMTGTGACVFASFVNRAQAAAVLA